MKCEDGQDQPSDRMSKRDRFYAGGVFESSLVLLSYIEGQIIFCAHFTSFLYLCKLI